MSKLYTLSVGHGNFAILQGRSEVIVIDTYLPSQEEKDTAFIQEVLTKLAGGRKVIGVILTGFGFDHAHPEGLGMVLRECNPEWVLYPKYYNGTQTADAVFRLVEEERKRRAQPLQSVSVSLGDRESLIRLSTLSSEFDFQAFSPHSGDETTSNNASLILKITERSTGRRILVTGDTESGRWDVICRYFGGELRADVLQAPHHGSRAGITPEAYRLISPSTVTISAGAGNPFGHPHEEAMAIYQSNCSQCCSTHTGHSVVTHLDRWSVKTFLFAPGEG